MWYPKNFQGSPEISINIMCQLQMLFCSQQKVKMMEGCNLFAETAELTGAMQIFDKNQSLHSAGCTHSLLLAVHFVSQQHVQRSRELQYLQPRS